MTIGINGSYLLNINSRRICDPVQEFARTLQTYLKNHGVKSDYAVIDGKPNDALLKALHGYANREPGAMLPQSMDITELARIAGRHKGLINKLYAERFA